MISWTVAGSVPFLTGATEIVGSSSHSSTGQASRIETDYTATGGGNSNANYTFISSTSHGHSKSTTYFSWSSSSSFSEAWGQTIKPNPETVPNLSYSDSASASGSSSGQATSELTTVVQTSTTQTYESAHYVTYTTTLEAYEGQAPIWTTSEDTITIAGQTQTSVAFAQTYATSLTALEASYETREATADALTTLEQTITLSGLPNTIVQAETRYPHNAEILYVITNPASDVTAYSAATDLAQSGTRFTLLPSVVTSEKNTANSTRPTSSIASSQATSLVNFRRSTTTQQAVTEADYNYFPPSTFTVTASAVTTTNTTLGTNNLSLQNDLPYGGTTNTVSAKSFGTYWKTVSNQIGTISFETAVVSTTTWSVTLSIEAAEVSSFSESANPPVTQSIWNGLTTALGNAASATFYSSAITANTNTPTIKATTGSGGQPAQNKYGTYGAAFGSEKGGWITANESSEGTVFFNGITALDGEGRRAITMFPLTEQNAVTIIAPGITWTRSTSAVLSIDGATSKSTTTSASFGVSGSTQTTGIGSIGHFGGQPRSQETFVQIASPGAYKNKVNSSTTSFDGAATLLSTSASIASWQAIKDIRGLVYTTKAIPIVWAEFRNSTAVPPATTAF